MKKIRSLIEDKARINVSNKRVGKKYLKALGAEKMDWLLNEEAIVHDEKFNGFYGIQISEKDLKAEAIFRSLSFPMED